MSSQLTFVTPTALSRSPFVSNSAISHQRDALPHRSVQRPSPKRASEVRMVQLTRQTSQGEVKRIVVTGTGVVSCFGCDSEKFYDSLLAGKSGVKKVQKFDVEGWKTDFAAWIEPEVLDTEGYVQSKMLRRLDPFLTYALIAGKKCLESAGLGFDDAAYEKLDKRRCGVLCGSGMGGMEIYTDGVEKLLGKGHKKMSPFFVPYAITNMVRGYYSKLT